jgi:flagellar hook-length control protein FliK
LDWFNFCIILIRVESEKRHALNEKGTKDNDMPTNLAAVTAPKSSVKAHSPSQMSDVHSSGASKQFGQALSTAKERQSQADAAPAKSQAGQGAASESKAQQTQASSKSVKSSNAAPEAGAITKEQSKILADPEQMMAENTLKGEGKQVAGDVTGDAAKVRAATTGAESGKAAIINKGTTSADLKTASPLAIADGSMAGEDSSGEVVSDEAMAGEGQNGNKTSLDSVRALKSAEKSTPLKYDGADDAPSLKAKDSLVKEAAVRQPDDGAALDAATHEQWGQDIGSDLKKGLSTRADVNADVSKKAGDAVSTSKDVSAQTQVKLRTELPDVAQLSELAGDHQEIGTPNDLYSEGLDDVSGQAVTESKADDPEQVLETLPHPYGSAELLAKLDAANQVDTQVVDKAATDAGTRQSARAAQVGDAKSVDDASLKTKGDVGALDSTGATILNLAAQGQGRAVPTGSALPSDDADAATILAELKTQLPSHGAATASPVVNGANGHVQPSIGTSVQGISNGSGAASLDSETQLASGDSDQGVKVGEKSAGEIIRDRALGQQLNGSAQLAGLDSQGPRPSSSQTPFTHQHDLASVGHLGQGSQPLTSDLAQANAAVKGHVMGQLVTGQPQMASELNERINFMVSQKMQSAEIRLDPAELGSMHIRLHMSGDQATVQVHVQNQQARDAIEQGMPKLRDMLAQQGIELGQSHIEQRSGGQPGFTGQGGFAQSGFEPSDGEEFIETPTDLRFVGTQTSDGIDYYA